MRNRPILSPRDVLASIHAALPPQRHGQRELPKLARHLCNLTASADLLAPPSLMARWIRHIPDATVVAIADAGHCVPMEQPDLFNRAVLEFVRDH